MKQRYRIVTKDGHEYVAEIYKLNPQYHRKADEMWFWRRVGDVPKKERYIQVKDVIVVEKIEQRRE